MSNKVEITRDDLYTLRWLAKTIEQRSSDSKVDELAVEQIKILSLALGENVPKEYQEPDVERETPKESTGVVYQIGKKDLWYPKAIKRTDLKMKTNGNYRKGYPEGLVVHYTAGGNNPIGTLQGGIGNGYMYMAMGEDGKIIQTNPLTQYGSHAGESAWVIDGVKQTSVSRFFCGVEICNFGILTKKNGKYYTYTNKEVPANQVRHIPKNNDNQAAGYYMKYTPEQEESVFELALWLKANNPTVFSFDNVVGHDEVAGPKGIGRWRKTDPGGALSMTMSQFRDKLKSEYKKRYGV